MLTTVTSLLLTISILPPSPSGTPNGQQTLQQKSRKIPCFTPPESWIPIDPATCSKTILIGFCEPTTALHPPSVNLAFEQFSSSVESYVSIVKKIHENKGAMHWKNLGSFKTLGGTGILTQFTTAIENETLSLFQLFIKEEETVYILTAAAPKENLPLLYPVIEKTFRSFSLLVNLEDAIADAVAKTAFLEAKKIAKNNKPSFQDLVLQQYSSLGPYWQALVFQELDKQ